MDHPELQNVIPAATLKGIEDNTLDTAHAMDSFLAGVERRAFYMAKMATDDTEEALDIVQDAMLKLVQRYAKRSQQEWGPLFHRIMQSRINDWYRRRKVRNRFRVWFGQNDDAQDGPEPVQALADPAGISPEHSAGDAEAMKALEGALHALPGRQQQAFLLRAWEGLAVKETAVAMGCSEGSVKTHYSRAVHALRDKLGEHR